MKQIFAGEAYDMIPQPGGIVFSYCREVVGDKVNVGYKMLSFDSARISDVAKNIYQLSKFGSNYRSVVSCCDNYVTARALLLQNGKVFLSEDNGSAKLFDVDGAPIWTGDLCYRGKPPQDIAVYQNNMWACYAEDNTLLRFQLSNFREELRIGGNKSPFRKPRDLFISGDTAVVSNSGSNKLLKMDLNHYTVTDYREFEEPVYGYTRSQDYEFVLLESGIYVL